MQDGAYLCQNPDQNPDKHSGRVNLWEHNIFTVDEAVPDVWPLVLPPPKLPLEYFIHLAERAAPS